MNYMLLVFNVFLLVGGQLLWEKGMDLIGPWHSGILLQLIKSPYILGGGLIYIFATVLWLYILTKLPFSIAYPFQSLAYVIGIFAGFLLFKETVNLVQWIGAAAIVFGVFLIAR